MDILFQTLTVRECLEFAAKLKLKGTEAEKKDRVDKIISELRLIKCQNTKIGGPLVKGVSGGERKRCSIGVELITDPYLIFLDEPTTGLHFSDINLLLGVLNELVHRGNTVLIIEHNMDVIKVADYIFDIGPEGGFRGGEIIAQGTPEMIAENPHSHTGKYLKVELPVK